MRASGWRRIGTPLPPALAFQPIFHVEESAMRCSRLVVCGLGSTFLLGSIVSWAANPPENPGGNNAPAAVARVADVAKQPADNPFGAGESRNPFGAGEARPAAKKPGATAAKPPRAVAVKGVAAIEAALAQPTQLDFDSTKLTDVVQFLQDFHHIPIHIDSSGLKDAGFDEITEITMRLKDVKLEKALTLLLDDVKLSWTIHDDVLYISTPEKVESLLETRVYDVADLVAYRDENDKTYDDYVPLSGLICETIDTNSWKDNGGIGTIRGESLGTAKTLVVTNVYANQRKIAALLVEIREVAAKKSGGDALPRRARAKAAHPSGDATPPASKPSAAPQKKPAPDENPFG
jgi:hypothetical protein